MDASARPAARARVAAPGLAVAVAGAALALGIHLLIPGVPWLTAALVLGVALGSIPAARPALDGILKPGLGQAARRLLRLGIVLLGLQLSLGDIAALGWLAILAIVGLVLAAFGATYGIARLLRLPGEQPLLLAAGFSICGVSAIGAVAGARRSREEDSALPTALVTLFGTLAIVVLPLLAGPLGLDARGFGVWTGASVHDVGQVVATAGVVGGSALSLAVVVKLTRVLLLAPVVAVVGLASRGARSGRDADGSGGHRHASRPPVVPLFLAGFAALAILGSVLDVPSEVRAVAAAVQSALLACALVAIGASLRLERLARSGLRGVAAGALSWLVILALALLVVAVS